MMPALAERSREHSKYRATQLLEDTGFRASPSARGIVIVGGGEPTGGQFDYAEVAADELVGWPILRDWMQMGAQAKVYFPTQPSDYIELGAGDENDFTVSLLAPSFRTRVGTGYALDELRAAMPALWGREMASVVEMPHVETETPLVGDIPETLQEARTKAGLPVQDLAAMFGIKRRQFYNLISGEDTTDAARERRIARVVEAIRRISDEVGGNSRKVRALLLARLDSDSVYDAGVADDADRLDRALERALAAAAEGRAVPRRSAPSTRATPEEAAAVRDFLSATRDDMGNDVPDA